MSVTIQQWHQSFQEFENTVQEFNQKVKKSLLSEDEIQRIYKVVKKETKRLQDLTKAAIAREDELNNRRCCNIPSKSLWLVAGLSGISVLFGFGGGVVGVIYESLLLQMSGQGLTAIAGILSAASGVLGYKVCIDDEEMTLLTQLDKQGVEHAKIFKKFLFRLKKIHRLQKEILKARKELSEEEKIILNDEKNSGSMIELNEKIRGCFKAYNSLTHYRTEEIYCKMISHLIQKLPPEDSLLSGLSQFEPNTEIGNMTSLVDKPLTINYLPSNENKSKFHHSSSNNEEHKWDVEEQGKSFNQSQEIVEESKREFQHKFSDYKYLVMDRFGLTEDIQFFETSHGWHIDRQSGIKKISKIEDEEEHVIFPVEEN